MKLKVANYSFYAISFETPFANMCAYRSIKQNNSNFYESATLFVSQINFRLNVFCTFRFQRTLQQEVVIRWGFLSSSKFCLIVKNDMVKVIILPICFFFVVSLIS